ncbi:MAG: 16S rRNA (adenine(1518)-N(6)/adenine(1519)-N(6))-dimethyltransferase RsmA [Patescibacteria group bacterium]|nr:16S rRNA (adenine(1518)-N(6)/adenine(1519)-N(6))-dimethyltransferase RsmA [Patescibacteria group bacterium]
MRPKKELGQNFLTDAKTVEKLISASNPQKTDVYLEIGAGEGAVTKVLAPRVKKVIAVELDPDLVPNLKRLTDTINNIDVINSDALNFICIDVSIHRYKINKVVGSIPYQITSPLLHCLAKVRLEIESVTLLIQKEVAQKILAKPPKASYLSNFVQTYFNSRFVVAVSRERFYPVPKVDGAVITIQPRGLDGKTPAVEPEIWSAFLHQCFKFPRKMLKKVFDEKILKETGIDSRLRPQEIELPQWQKLFNLYDYGKKI